MPHSNIVKVTMEAVGYLGGSHASDLFQLQGMFSLEKRLCEGRQTMLYLSINMVSQAAAPRRG